MEEIDKNLLLQFCKYRDRINGWSKREDDDIINWFILSIERKTPIAKSFDGVDLFYGDILHLVDKRTKKLYNWNCNIESCGLLRNHYDDNTLYFADIEKARNYHKEEL